jgi:hypothetical protein
MVPKRDHCYRYEAKAEAFVFCEIVLKRGTKPVTRQFIRSWSGQKLWRITPPAFLLLLRVYHSEGDLL